MSDIDSTIDEFIAEGRDRFRASYLARRANVCEREAREALERYVAAGRLAHRFELLCCESDRTIATYLRRDEVPVEREVDCPLCEEPHFIVPQDIWVTYGPPQRNSVYDALPRP